METVSANPVETHDSEAVKQKTKVNRFLSKLLLALGGVLMACLLAELAFRIAGYSYPIFYTTDPYRGYSLQSGVEGWSWVEHKNYIRINSAGFRDREHSKTKPDDTIRIAVLGDSFVEARQVPIEEAFWGVVEQGSQQCGAFGGKQIEVMSFGVDGYGTAQELLTLRQRVWDYSPDIVVLTVTTYNDITDNYRLFKQTEEIPYFVYQDGKLTYDGSFKDSGKYRWYDSRLFKAWVSLHNHSRLLQLLHHAQFAVKTRISYWKERRRLSQIQQRDNNILQSLQKREQRASADEIGIVNMVYREPEDYNWNEAWRVTEGLITQMRDEVRKGGARFLVVTMSSDIQVYPDRAARKAFEQKLGVRDLFYPDRRLQALAEREGIAFLDLAQPMQAYADQNKTFLHGFGKEIGNGHWNIAGNSVAGQIIAQSVCAGNFN